MYGYVYSHILMYGFVCLSSTANKYWVLKFEFISSFSTLFINYEICRQKIVGAIRWLVKIRDFCFYIFFIFVFYIFYYIFHRFKKIPGISYISSEQ